MFHGEWKLRPHSISLTEAGFCLSGSLLREDSAWRTVGVLESTCRVTGGVSNAPDAQREEPKMKQKKTDSQRVPGPHAAAGGPGRGPAHSREPAGVQRVPLLVPSRPGRCGAGWSPGMATATATPQTPQSSGALQ